MDVEGKSRAWLLFQHHSSHLEGPLPLALARLALALGRLALALILAALTPHTCTRDLSETMNYNGTESENTGARRSSLGTAKNFLEFTFQNFSPWVPGQSFTSSPSVVTMHNVVLPKLPLGSSCDAQDVACRFSHFYECLA